MAAPLPIAGIVLAGGLSRRMGGGDKPLLRLGGRPMILHVAERLRPQVGALALNANGDPARFASFGLPVLADSIQGFAGPLAGILAGLDWAASNGAAALVSAAGDTPFVPTDLVARLAAAASQEGVALAASGGARHPVFGLWPTMLREPLRRFLEGGGRRVTEFADRHGAISVDFPPVGVGSRTVDPFLNVNTPADLAEAQAILAGAGA